MASILLVVLAALVSSQAPVDVASLKVGSPAVIARLDTATLGGEPRRLAWSSDRESLYLQSVAGRPPSEKVRHFVLTRSSGELTPIEREPDWAALYWEVKQDRVAPGLPNLVIEIEETTETFKAGPGPAGTLDRANPGALTDPNLRAQDLADGTSGNQKGRVVRLRLLGQEIAKWGPAERPIPGVRFGWGPSGTGALVYLGERGELIFFDQRKHKRPVPAVRDALLPAWSQDGQMLAYVQKAGRQDYVVAWLPVGR